MCDAHDIDYVPGVIYLRDDENCFANAFRFMHKIRHAKAAAAASSWGERTCRNGFHDIEHSFLHTRIELAKPPQRVRRVCDWISHGEPLPRK